MESDATAINLSVSTDGARGGGGRRTRTRAGALICVVLAGAATLPARSAAVPALSRPTDPGASDGYRTDDVRTHRSGAFAVHWVTSTNDRASTAFVKDVLDVMEEVRRHQVVELGWPAPAGDAGVGGSGAIDVYLLDLGGQSGDDERPFGYAAADGPPRCGGGRCQPAPGYIVLENDFDGYPPDPRSALRATAAHEFGHLVHLAIAPTGPGWAYESTGVWLESSTYPDLDARSLYLDDFADAPDLSLTDFSAEGGFDRAYGAYVFNRWIASRHGEGVIRDAWTAPDARAGDVGAGYATVLRARGSSFVEELLGLATASASWDVVKSELDPAVPSWPEVVRADVLAPGARVDVELDHAAYWIADIAPAASVEVVVRGPKNVAGGAALVAVHGDDVRDVTDATLLDGEARLRLDGLAGAERVSVVVVNGDLTPSRPKAPQDDAVRYVRDDVAYVVGVDVDPGLPPRP